tara:strand:+ start:2384 stop:2578 length:195 start_codon:yes stop_codon:yes gene_type:complete
MKEERDIRAEIIAEEIMGLANDLDNYEDLRHAWLTIKFGLDYLSAKDSMYDNERRFNAKKEERN